MNKNDWGSVFLVSLLVVGLLGLGLPVYALDVLQVNNTDYFWGIGNVTGDQIYHNNTATSYNLSYTFDNATLSTRSLSDFGSSQTNYATLYIVNCDFHFGWSSTLYDVYRYQDYECIGAPSFGDWLYTGLLAPLTRPTSFAQTGIPWYVPIIGYLAAVLLPMMIISYYWNKARDWKSGLMVLFVCCLCYILFMMLWNVSDALMRVMYQ